VRAYNVFTIYGHIDYAYSVSVCFPSVFDTVGWVTVRASGL